MPFNATLLAPLGIHPFSNRDDITRIINKAIQADEENSDNRASLLQARDELLEELASHPNLVGLIKTPKELNGILSHYSFDMNIFILGFIDELEHKSTVYQRVRESSNLNEMLWEIMSAKISAPKALGQIFYRAIAKAVDTKPRSVLENMTGDKDKLKTILKGLSAQKSRAIIMYLRHMPNFKETGQQLIDAMKQSGQSVLSINSARNVQQGYLQEAFLLNRLQGVFTSPRYSLTEEAMISVQEVLKKLFFYLEFNDCLERTEGNVDELTKAYQCMHTHYSKIAQLHDELIGLLEDENVTTFDEELELGLPFPLNVQLCNALKYTPGRFSPFTKTLNTKKLLHGSPTNLFIAYSTVEIAEEGGECDVFIDIETGQHEQRQNPEPVEAELPNLKAGLFETKSAIILCIDSIVSRLDECKNDRGKNRQLVEDKIKFLIKIKLSFQKVNDVKSVFSLCHIALYVCGIETNIANKITLEITSRTDKMIQGEWTGSQSLRIMKDLFAGHGFAFPERLDNQERRAQVLNCLARHASPMRIVDLFELNQGLVLQKESAVSAFSLGEYAQRVGVQTIQAVGEYSSYWLKNLGFWRSAPIKTVTSEVALPKDHENGTPHN